MIPMPDAPLHYRSAIEIGALIRKGEVSSLEVTTAQLDRIAALDPILNSYINVTEELALNLAREADAVLARGEWRGPLHGVPVAVKDICDIAGLPTTAGMPIRRNSHAATDSSVVIRLKKAGAVILGKTNLTEGVYAEHVQPYGPPVNPWRNELWPGASSSGSGVAIAAGLCFAAIGSDTGGSIRLPSAVNGVTGLKPTWGRVSRHGVFELAATLDHIGTMARTAVDTGVMLHAVAGFDPRDPTTATVPVPEFLVGPGADLSGLRVGVDPRWVSEDVDVESTAALLEAVAALKRLGAEERETTFPDPRQIVLDWFEVCAAQAAVAHRDTYPARRSEYGPALATLLDIGNTLKATDYQERILRRESFRGSVQALFEAIDVLAIPVLAFPPPTIERMVQVDEETIFGLHRFTCPFTMSGNPTITLPGGASSAGVPLAVQFVGPYFSEPRLVRIGHAFQAATDWHLRHPLL
jgi:amidase